MAKIFISYRREDSATACGRIYDRLILQFGRANIFKDVDSIPLGVNFQTYTKDIIAQCSVQLVIIGRHWIDSSDANGRRIDNPSDYVRVEIEEALRRRIVVIPVLVQSATLPSRELLPVSIQPLVESNGVQVRDDPDFDADIHRLISAVVSWVSAGAPPASAIPAASPLSPLSPLGGIHATPNRQRVAPPGQPVSMPTPVPQAPVPGPGTSHPQQPIRTAPVRKNHVWLIVGAISTALVVVCCVLFVLPAIAVNGLLGNSAATATAQAAPGAVLYSNTLNGDARSGWISDSSCFFGSGGYHIKASIICIAPASDTTDAVTTVTVSQISGPTNNAYGLVIRYVSSGNFYRFDIDADGDWVFNKVVNDTSTNIVTFTANSAIMTRLNQANTLSVTARGSHFVFSVNGTQVGTADDSTFTSGGTGLEGVNGIEVVFTNLTIANPQS